MIVNINEENKNILIEGGMELIVFDEPFVDEVLERAEGVYDSIGAAIGQEYIDALLDALENAQ